MKRLLVILIALLSVSTAQAQVLLPQFNINIQAWQPIPLLKLPPGPQAGLHCGDYLSRGGEVVNSVTGKKQAGLMVQILLKGLNGASDQTLTLNFASESYMIQSTASSGLPTVTITMDQFGRLGRAVIDMPHTEFTAALKCLLPPGSAI